MEEKGIEHLRNIFLFSEHLTICRYKTMTALSEAMRNNYKRVESIGRDISKIGESYNIAPILEIGKEMEQNASSGDFQNIKRNVTELFSHLNRLTKLSVDAIRNNGG
ncbi:MAG: hypothetical protein KAV87_64015 [Desulfobacteraceae bacterium]|nr:hypothetical protein [Desulfobacteraceae bacterium]